MDYIMEELCRAYAFIGLSEPSCIDDDDYDSYDVFYSYDKLITVYPLSRNIQYIF